VTPGHTQGCTTWTTVQKENEQPLHVVFNCSVSVPDEYRLLGNARYPRAVEDYERSFRILRALPCDVLLGPHASFFHQDERRAETRGRSADPVRRRGGLQGVPGPRGAGVPRASREGAPRPPVPSGRRNHAPCGTDGERLAASVTRITTRRRCFSRRPPAARRQPTRSALAPRQRRASQL